MPRILGYRERLSVNHYDALFCAPAEKLQDPEMQKLLGQHVRMFGNANLGNLALTDMQVPNMLAGDQTMVILNWYARTTMPRSQAFEQFAHSTIAQLVIGMKPYGSMPLAELLNRREGDVMGRRANPALTKIGRDESIKELAASMWAAHAHGHEDGITFGDLDGVAAKRWLRTAEHVVSAVNAECGRPVIVPVRQFFEVVVDIWDQGALHVAFDGLPKPMGSEIGMFGVWIHLEGLQVRDVA